MYADESHTVDERGRKVVKGMSERELLEEILLRQRAFDDTIEGLMQNPMIAAAIPGFGG